jgi:hypothetical protein
VNQGQNAFDIDVANIGKTCVNARFALITPDTGQKFKAPADIRNWITGRGYHIRLALGSSRPPTTLMFTIAYNDEVMVKQHQTFKLSLKRFPLDNTSLGVSRIDMSFNPPQIEMEMVGEHDEEEDT